MGCASNILDFISFLFLVLGISLFLEKINPAYNPVNRTLEKVSSLIKMDWDKTYSCWKNWFLLLALVLKIAAFATSF